jgi:VCBS repeat-containing protein
MSVNVVGTLIDPVGQPLQTTLRITAQNSNVTLKGAYSTIMVNSGGAYNFNLQEGIHLIQFLQKKEYTEGTIIIVDNTVPSTITLGSLLANHEGQP